MNNLNLMFNKTYYEKLGCPKEELEKDIEKKNKVIFGTVFDPDKDFVPCEIAGEDEKFRLMTTYPGILIGTGNPHGTGEADSDINTGFSFDYVTGQPYIPGSSVKGILRSYFETPEKRRAITQILKGIDGTDRDDKKILEIEKDIFDGRDVFLDAVVARGGYYGELVGPDYLTPHKSPVSDPVPIHIIKVIPDVVFEFRFRLCEDALLPRKTKTELFKAILLYFGAGAKTNTGYGRFTEVKGVPKAYREIRTVQADKNSRNNNNLQQKQKDKAADISNERINCPHCGAINLAYMFGRKVTRCSKCKKTL